jgi:hypothetical protein
MPLVADDGAEEITEWSSDADSGMDDNGELNYIGTVNEQWRYMEIS